MKKVIDIDDKKIEFTIRKLSLSKNLRLSLTKNGYSISAPKYVTIKVITAFIHDNKEWVLRHFNKFLEYSTNSSLNKNDYKKYKKQALLLATKKVELFNKYYNFKFNKIFIRNQKSRWGSCSSTGNLSFNYQIVHLREDLLDYLIVHELCHLDEMNHSKSFYNLIAKTIPKYKLLQKELKNIHL